MKFVSISSSSGFFRDISGSGNIGYQGILGLAPDTDLITGTTSYITPLFGSGGVHSEFAFQLCSDSGTMWIGGGDPHAEDSAPAFTPMGTMIPGSYTVAVARMALGTGSDLGGTSDFGPTIIDTGTSIAFIPAGPLGTLTTQIQASSGYKTVFATQSLTAGQGCVMTTMTSAQVDAALPPLHLAFPSSSGSPSGFVDLEPTHSYLFFAGTMAGQNGYCFALADSAMLGAPVALSLFGDTMLASYETIFDIANNQMGFAKETGCAEATADLDLPASAAPAYTPDRPWWQQDARVRTPDPAQLRRRLARLAP